MALRVVVTGAAGQIAYSLLYSLAKGDVFGPNQEIELVLLDIEMMMGVLEGVVMELQDCALPLLKEIVPSCNANEAFKNVDCAILVGAMPRKEGMERKDLLKANVKIFKAQGEALDKYAKKDVKVVVIGNPANTNAMVCSYFAPSIKKENFTALTRLDQNRAQAQIAARLNIPNKDVSNCAIWGNHSNTQYADVRNAVAVVNGKSVGVYEAVKDDAWIRGNFLTTVQTRGAAVIKARKLSSAMSAAKAICDHVRDWWFGSDGRWVSMGVPSDGSYGIPEGVVYSFPVVCKGNKSYEIVKGIEIDDFSRSKMDLTLAELQQEKESALEECLSAAGQKAE